MDSPESLLHNYYLAKLHCALPKNSSGVHVPPLRPSWCAWDAAAVQLIDWDWETPEDEMQHGGISS
jgi:hypothetical protein